METMIPTNGWLIICSIVFLIGGPFIKFIQLHKITGPIRKDGPIDHIVKKLDIKGVFF